MNQNNGKSSLKKFFIKLIAITFAVVVVINMTYNLIFAEKFESINKLLNLNKKQNIDLMKNKIRIEIRNSLEKDRIFNDTDKKLLYEFYLKIKNEFKDIQ